MESLQFSIQINAHPEIVYRTLIDPVHYRNWTYVFGPTSFFEGTWQKGTKMYFLAKDKNGVLGGMLSRINENIPNEFISIEHYGLIQNGEEITDGEEVEKMKGTLENYTLSRNGNQTELKVEMNNAFEMKEYFQEAFPKALEIVKRICEEESH